MGYKRVGGKCQDPPGKWVQTTDLISVAGIQYRRGSVEEFVAAVEKADYQGLVYGLQLEHQPNHPQDSNAIAVYGVAECARWLRSATRMEWHVGYLEREIAREIQEDLVSKGIPVAARLHDIYVGDGGFIDIRLFVLAPPGHSASARRRRRGGQSS